VTLLGTSGSLLWEKRRAYGLNRPAEEAGAEIQVLWPPGEGGEKLLVRAIPAGDSIKKKMHNLVRGKRKDGAFTYEKKVLPLREIEGGEKLGESRGTIWLPKRRGGRCFFLRKGKV